MFRHTVVALALTTVAGCGMMMDRKDGLPAPTTASGFLINAAQSGMLEVNASRLALERSKNSAVRSFAQNMVDDHTKANEEVMKLAEARKVALPRALAGEQRVIYERLQGLSGTEFDRNYAATVGVSAHEKTIRMFETASTSVDDSQLRSFVQKTLPTLQHHLREARKLQETVAR